MSEALQVRGTLPACRQRCRPLQSQMRTNTRWPVRSWLPLLRHRHQHMCRWVLQLSRCVGAIAALPHEQELAEPGCRSPGAYVLSDRCMQCCPCCQTAEAAFAGQLCGAGAPSTAPCLQGQAGMYAVVAAVSQSSVDWGKVQDCQYLKLACGARCSHLQCESNSSFFLI